MDSLEWQVNAMHGGFLGNHRVASRPTNLVCPNIYRYSNYHKKTTNMS
jgi:hypothetical protein